MNGQKAPNMLLMQLLTVVALLLLVAVFLSIIDPNLAPEILRLFNVQHFIQDGQGRP